MFHSHSRPLENITLCLRDFCVHRVLLQSNHGSKIKPTIIVSKGLENLCMELKSIPEEKHSTHYGQGLLQCHYCADLFNSLDKHCCLYVVFLSIDCIKIGLKFHVCQASSAEQKKIACCTT